MKLLRVIEISFYNKMMAGFAAIIAIMGLGTSYVLYELHGIAKDTEVTLTADVESVSHAKKLKALLYDEEGYVQKYLISDDDTYFQLLVESIRQFNQTAGSLHAVQTEKTEKSLANQIVNAHRRVEGALKTKTKIAAIPDRNLVVEKWHGSFSRIHFQLDYLISLNQKAIGFAMSRAEAASSRSISIALTLVICTLVVAVMIAYLIARTITKPVAGLIEGTSKIAKGSFERIEIQSRDEMAQLAIAFNDMSRELKRNSEFKAEMMQQITHELRNPLQIISSSHELLKVQLSGKLSEDQLELLDALEIGADRIGAFSHQYLDMAKDDAGMLEYKMVLSDFSAIIEPIVSETRLIGDSRGIPVNFEIKQTLPEVFVDPEKMGIIFRNLLSNAIKYSPDGKQIDILVTDSELGICVTIRDQGIGIPPEDLPNVFRRFYQAKNAGEGTSKGTGLGLAIVRTFTEGHGGKVSVESKLNSGSSFTVELPSASSSHFGADGSQNEVDNHVS